MFAQLLILLLLLFLLLTPLIWVGTRLSIRTEMNDASSDEEDDGQGPPVYLPPPPAKGILKKTSSLDIGETSQHKPPPEPVETKKKKKKMEVERKKSARFDEMNIIATLHPADKEYGHDTIDEPKTPFSWDLDEGTSADTKESVSACDLAAKLLQLSSTMPTVVEKPAVRGTNSNTSINSELSDVDEDKLTEEEKRKKKAFELRRKAHYDEFKVAKKMPLNLESDLEGDDEEGKKKRKKKGK